MKYHTDALLGTRYQVAEVHSLLVEIKNWLLTCIDILLCCDTNDGLPYFVVGHLRTNKMKYSAYDYASTAILLYTATNNIHRERSHCFPKSK
jgi:hypothetical protein